VPIFLCDFIYLEKIQKYDYVLKSMNTLKILVPYPTGHETVSIRTLLFNNLIKILKKKTDVKIQRVLYQPKKIDSISDENPDIVTLDLHNYKNAFEILKKEKPDIVYANPYPGFIDFSFVFASKILNIPIFSILNYEPGPLKSFDIVKLYSKKFFSNYVEVEISKNKKSFMRRAKFIIYKFFFMYNTIFSSKLGLIKNFKTLLLIFNLILQPPKIVDPRLAVTMHYLRNKTQEKELLSVGFDPSTLLVTGHPMFDQALKKIKSKNNIDPNGKIKLLLAPDPFYEAGMWTKDQHNSILTQLIKTISKSKNHFSLKVKIHPSSASISEYEFLIHSLDSTIPIFQKGSIEDYLDDVDIILAYSSASTGLIYSLIENKPIVICNFFNRKNDRLIDAGLALECKESSLLIDTIKRSINPDNLFEQKRDIFIKKYFYKGDGLASERICENLLNLLKVN